MHRISVAWCQLAEVEMLRLVEVRQQKRVCCDMSETLPVVLGSCMYLRLSHYVGMFKWVQKFPDVGNTYAPGTSRARYM